MTPRNENARRAPGEAFGSASGGARRANDSGPLDFARVAADALQRADAVLSRWLPGGKWQGAEYTALNPTRSDSKPGSFRVNRSGKWSDFATGDKGGDLVSLVAMLDGTDQATAARALAAFLGTGAAGPIRQAKPAPAAPASKPRPPDTAVAPVPADAPAPPDRHPAHGAPSAVWTYRDAAGAALFRVCRFDTAEGKQVLPQSLHREPEGLRWRWKGLPTPRPLYGLDRLAAAPDLPVIVCEGEKAADAAARLLPGWVAVTSPNGSNSATSADWGPLAGRRCVVWPDADPAGAGYAADVQRLALAAGAAAVAVADLEPLALIRGADLPQGFDAADAEGESLDAEALDAWLRQELEAPADHAEELAEEAPDPAEGAATEDHPADPADRLPCFRLVEWVKGKRPGVYWCDLDRRSAEPRPAEPLWLCDPLHILALTRDGTGHGWGRLLQWRDQDRRVHRWAVPARLLVGDGQELAAALADRGLTLAGGRARAKLLDYLAQARPGQFARCVQRTGWAGRAFVLPDEVIGDADGEPVVFQAPSPEGAKFATAGTAEGWRQSVAAACVGNSRLTFAVSVALAGPCVGLIDAEPGGFHLYGGTSAGKSTALRVAASVWGGPAFVKSWRMTANGLEGVAAVHTDTVLLLDELGELGARDAAPVAYSLANGAGKARARTDGAARAPATWRVLFLSSGEVQLADLIGEAGGRTRGGQEVRFAAIPADAGAGLGLFDRLPEGMTAGQFADTLKDATAADHGHAGRQWLEYLTANHADARAALRELRDGIAEELTPPDAAGAVRRVAHRFALVAAAGELASAAGVTDWPAREATAAARACFAAWLGQRGTAGAPEPLAMLRQVRRILERDGEARFVPIRSDGSDGQALAVRDRLGFRRSVEAGTEFLVLREAFRSELAAGFNPDAVARALADAGALKLDTDGGKTRKEYLPGIGRERCYVITPAVWGASP